MARCWGESSPSPACHIHATKLLQVHWQTNGITCGGGGGIFIYQINGMVKRSVRSETRSLKHILKLITQSSILCTNLVFPTLRLFLVGGYTACGIPLIRSANGNGNRIPLNGIVFNGIPLTFVSVKVYLSASVNCQKR